jgi:hypothetical protein
MSLSRWVEVGDRMLCSARSLDACARSVLLLIRISTGEELWSHDYYTLESVFASNRDAGKHEHLWRNIEV